MPALPLTSVSPYVNHDLQRRDMTDSPPRDQDSAQKHLRPPVPPRRQSGSLTSDVAPRRLSSSSALSSMSAVTHGSTDSVYSASECKKGPAIARTKGKNHRLSATFWRSKQQEVQNPRSSPAPGKDVPRPVWYSTEEEEGKKGTRTPGRRSDRRSHERRRRSPPSVISSQPGEEAGCSGSPRPWVACPKNSPCDDLPDECWNEGSCDEPQEVMSLEGVTPTMSRRRSSVHTMISRGNSRSIRRGEQEDLVEGNRPGSANAGKYGPVPLHHFAEMFSPPFSILGNTPAAVEQAAKARRGEGRNHSGSLITVNVQFCGHDEPETRGRNSNSTGSNRWSSTDGGPRSSDEGLAPAAFYDFRRSTSSSASATTSVTTATTTTTSDAVSGAGHGHAHAHAHSGSLCSGTGTGISSVPDSELNTTCAANASANAEVALHRLCTPPSDCKSPQGGRAEEEEDDCRSSSSENAAVPVGYSDIEYHRDLYGGVHHFRNEQQQQHPGVDEAKQRRADDHYARRSSHKQSPHLLLHSAGSRRGLSDGRRGSCSLHSDHSRHHQQLTGSSSIPVAIPRQEEPSLIASPPHQPSIRVPTLDEQRVALRPSKNPRNQRPNSVDLHLDLGPLSNYHSLIGRTAYSDNDHATSPSSVLEITTTPVNESPASASVEMSFPLAMEYTPARRRADSMTERMPGSSTSSSSFERTERMISPSSGSRRPTTTSSSRNVSGPSSASRRARPNALQPAHLAGAGGGDPWGMMVVHAVPSDRERPSTRSSHSKSSAQHHASRPSSRREGSRRPATSSGPASGGSFGSPVRLPPISGDASFLPTATVRLQQKSGLKARLKNFFDPRKKQPEVEFDEIIS